MNFLTYIIDLYQVINFNNVDRASSQIRTDNIHNYIYIEIWRWDSNPRVYKEQDYKSRAVDHCATPE